MEAGDLIEIVLELLFSTWEILIKFKISLIESFFKYLRKMGGLLLPNINWVCTELWENLKLSEKLTAFFIKVCEWILVFSNAWVFYYKQLLSYFYLICQMFFLGIQIAIKYLFDFEFKAFHDLAIKSCHRHFNLVYQYFLIFYNMYLFLAIVVSTKIYSLASFLSGHTEKIFISEVFFKSENFWILSEHDHFGSTPILIKYLDNFYNSAKYFDFQGRRTSIDTKNSLIRTPELDTFLKNLSKSYEELFCKSSSQIKTWVMEVYAIFFALIHIFFKLINTIIDMLYIFADSLIYFIQTI